MPTCHPPAVRRTGKGIQTRAPRPGCPGTGGDFGPDLPLFRPAAVAGCGTLATLHWRPGRIARRTALVRLPESRIASPGRRRRISRRRASPVPAHLSSSALLTPRESAPRRRGRMRYTAYIPTLSSRSCSPSHLVVLRRPASAGRLEGRQKTSAATRSRPRACFETALRASSA